MTGLPPSTRRWAARLAAKINTDTGPEMARSRKGRAETIRVRVLSAGDEAHFTAIQRHLAGFELVAVAYWAGDMAEVERLLALYGLRKS